MARFVIAITPFRVLPNMVNGPDRQVIWNGFQSPYAGATPHWFWRPIPLSGEDGRDRRIDLASTRARAEGGSRIAAWGTSDARTASGEAGRKRVRR
ncbi:hypothetical protein GCM10018793_42270 [Streptomyces sulfonofaciens]|uniref:Uncharacterized protein n=1 Tax=Streptomyces sulfonofaciens TaxID=68272 RepID=A0A919L3D5_9ACTN|nr:hypothetical protein GCM10018793_42270 [Streptomyces sulfonofaciens]